MTKTVDWDTMVEYRIVRPDSTPIWTARAELYKGITPPGYLVKPPYRFEMRTEHELDWTIIYIVEEESEPPQPRPGETASQA